MILVNEFDISVKRTWKQFTVSRKLQLQDNSKCLETLILKSLKLLTKSKLTSITIDIDSSVINVEGHQEGASKGYNPKKLGNRCYNIQFAFCDELKKHMLPDL